MFLHKDLNPILIWSFSKKNWRRFWGKNCGGGKIQIYHFTYICHFPRFIKTSKFYYKIFDIFGRDLIFLHFTIRLLNIYDWNFILQQKKRKTEAELKEFKPLCWPAGNQFQLSAGSKLGNTFNFKWNQPCLNHVSYLSHSSNSLKSASHLFFTSFSSYLIL